MLKIMDLSPNFRLKFLKGKKACPGQCLNLAPPNGWHTNSFLPIASPFHLQASKWEATCKLLKKQMVIKNILLSAKLYVSINLVSTGF